MKGGKRQLESRKGTYGTGRNAGSDPCQQTERRCRTTLAKRIQGTIWAVGETALPEAEAVSLRLRISVAMVFRGQKPTRRARKRLELGRPVGIIGCGTYGEECRRTWETSAPPANPSSRSPQQRKEDEGKGKSSWGVRSTRSTQRMNKTFTGGRS